jgi:hypothetical protein
MRHITKFIHYPIAGNIFIIVFIYKYVALVTFFNYFIYLSINSFFIIESPLNLVTV